VFFRVTRVVNDFLCPNVVSFDLADIEVLLFNRMPEACEHYLAPMDECYKPVGVICACWHALAERRGGMAAAESRVL